MRCANPSTIAVLPTPGSPINTGLFLVRRCSTWITRRISLVAADDGIELAVAGALGEVDRVFLERLALPFRVGIVHGLVCRAPRRPHSPGPRD